MTPVFLDPICHLIAEVLLWFPDGSDTGGGWLCGGADLVHRAFIQRVARRATEVANLRLVLAVNGDASVAGLTTLLTTTMSTVPSAPAVTVTPRPVPLPRPPVAGHRRRTATRHCTRRSPASGRSPSVLPKPRRPIVRSRPDTRTGNRTSAVIELAGTRGC
jgi:hypothetical protein